MHPFRTHPTSPLARLARAAVVALLATAGLASAVPAASAAVDSPSGDAGSDDVAWAVRTASNAYGNERPRFTYTLNRGESVDDALVVANRGTSALELVVYAADGYTTDSGEFDVRTQDDESAGVGAWVDPVRDTVTIEAGEQVEVPFSLTVPDAATPGDYAGAIVTSLTRPDEEQGVNVDQRLGVRVDLHVAGATAPALVVEDARVGYSGSLNPFASGDATVTYTLHNTGNVIMSARQAASVAGPFGWLPADAGDVAAPPDLLPGESWQVTVPVDGVVPLLRVTAHATVTPVFTEPSGSQTALQPVAVTALGWAVPWAALALLVVLAALVVGATLLRRRLRSRRRTREEERVQHAVEQALRERETLAS